MSKNEHCHSDCGFTGPQTAFHRPFFHMVVLKKMHCECALNALNKHALPFEPEVSNNKTKEENKSPSKGEKVEQQ